MMYTDFYLNYERELVQKYKCPKVSETSRPMSTD